MNFTFTHKSFFKKVTRYFIVLFAAMFYLLPNYAAAGCSPYAGQASLNEFFKDKANQSNDNDDFLEVKILNPTITSSIFNNWSVMVCEELGGGSQNDTNGCTLTPIPLSDFTVSNTPWKVLSDGDIGKYINFKTGFEAILLDHNNDVIDYVSVAIDGAAQLEEASCKGIDLPFPYLAGAPGASDKFIFRTPDGTGPWDSASSGAADGTVEDTNDTPSGGGTYPVLTVSDVTVTKGTTASFTLTLDKSIDDPVVIFYETKGGTAIPSISTPSDYTYTKSSITFPANTTTLTLNVDILTEGTSPASSGTVFFYLYLSQVSNPTTSYANANIQNAYPKGTILGTTSQKIVLSTGSTETLDGLTSTNGSLAEYDPTSSPAQLFFGESKFASGDENISAVHVLPDGNIILSTGGSATLGLNSLSINDGDLVKYNSTTDIASLYFSESNFSGNEDITAVYIPDDESYIILATSDDAVLGTNSFSFRKTDLVKYFRTGSRAGEAELFLDKDLHFTSGTGAIDGVHVLESGNLLISTTESATLGGYSFRDGDIVEYNPTTKISSLYFDQNLFSRNGADINALTLPKAIVPPALHHFEIRHDGIGLTCESENIYVKACADASCSALYTSDVTVTPSPTSAGDTSWLPSPQVITASTETTLQLSHKALTPSGAVSQTLALNINSTAPAPTDSNVICKDIAGNVSSCDIVFYDSGFTYTIPTQISCETSVTPITIKAVRKDNTTQQCISLFTGPASKTIDFTISTAPNPDIVMNSGLANEKTFTSAAATQSVDLSFNNSEATFTLTHNNAGQFTLAASHINSGLTMLGSSSFVVRPHSYFAEAVYDNAGTEVQLDNATSINTPTWKASDNFRLRLRGQCSDGRETTNYVPTNAEMFIELAAPDQSFPGNHSNLTIEGTDFISSYPEILPAPPYSPIWHPISALFSGGAITDGINDYANAAFHEVGVLTLHVRDSNYFSATIPEQPLSIGRFTPHHFDTIALDACTNIAPLNSFTYSGQPFTLQTKAMNNLATPLVTKNYDGTSFAKAVVLSTTSSVAGSFGTTANIASSDFVNGSYIKTDVAYTFTSKDSGPDASFIIRATDSVDGINSNDTSAIEGTTDMRSGRVYLENVFGSELTALTMPFKAEHYLNNGFIINSDDTCTTYDATAGSLTNYTDNLSTGETTLTGATPISGGLANIIFSAPGTDNDGSVTLLADNVSSWLTYNWNVDCDNVDGDNDITTGIDAGLCGPVGTSSFGLYRGDDRIIYWREVF